MNRRPMNRRALFKWLVGAATAGGLGAAYYGYRANLQARGSTAGKAVEPLSGTTPSARPAAPTASPEKAAASTIRAMVHFIVGFLPTFASPTDSAPPP